MPDSGRWSPVIPLARLFKEDVAFESAERDYKLLLAEAVAQVRATLDDREASLAVLKRAMRHPQNNVVAWRVVDDFLKLTEREPAKVIAALEVLWSEGDLRDRIAGFIAALPPDALAGPGAVLSVASFLALGSAEATDVAIYRARPVRTIRVATDWPEPKDASPAELYADWLDLVDDFVSAARSAGLDVRDRLDAQSMLYCIASWGPQEHWSAADRRALAALLGGEVSTRLWAVYVGDASMGNLAFSLPQGRWGWKKRQDDYGQLEPGDLLLFATGFTGGSPRKDAGAFLEHGLQRLILCRTTSGVYEDADPFWPDESDPAVSYPFRVDLEVVDDGPGLDVAKLDDHFGGPVAEAIRLSAINQGRANLVMVTAAVGPGVLPASFDEVVFHFAEVTGDSGLDYGTRHEQLIRSFVTALATKPFVILTGLSGSGKTRLAQAFGRWLGAVRVVAVRPDWTSPDALLGFENALSEPVDGRYAWNVPETLEFLLEARDDPHTPHLLLLDEMNLAHVERYFADVLSGMESRAPVIPDLVREGGAYRMRPGSTGKVELPGNLLIVGTVNVDETTYLFSPKVLDRANTFEFRVTDADLVASRPQDDPGRATSALASGFLQATRSRIEHDEQFAEWLRSIHRILARHDREFGHRTFQEALRFAGLLREAGEDDALVALDCQVLQKVLPKLHGSRRELAVLLDEIGSFCMNGPDAGLVSGFDCAATPDEAREAELPGNYAKVHRMARKLATTTS